MKSLVTGLVVISLVVIVVVETTAVGTWTAIVRTSAAASASVATTTSTTRRTTAITSLITLAGIIAAKIAAIVVAIIIAIIATITEIAIIVIATRLRIIWFRSAFYVFTIWTSDVNGFDFPSRISLCIVFNLLAFAKGSKTFSVDDSLMDENIVAATGGSDETETLL